MNNQREHKPSGVGDCGNGEPTPGGGNSGLTPAARRGGIERCWLLTWTTYGTWLPGDDRGFVSNVDRGDGKGQRLNQPGTDPASAMRGLTRMAQQAMKGPPVFLDADQARVLLEQFQETANYRGWQLLAVAIMRNHVHLVVGVPGDPEPETLLRDFKSYGSRALNKRWPSPPSGTWWTESGSRRKLPHEPAIVAAVAYGYLLKYGGCEIPFRIEAAERSQLTINVFPDMRVEVLAPSDRPLDAILTRVDRRAKWIVKQWRYFEQYLPAQPDRRYVSGETHLYLGRQFRLKLSQGTPSEVKLVGRFFRVQHSDCGNIEAVRSLLDDWYLSHARSLFLNRLRQCQENCRTLEELNSPNITVRKMSRRWGSCTQGGNISLNVDLVKTPIYCIDYVIIHELCHLKIHNHSPAFYRLLTRCMPDWEKRKAKLDSFRLE